MNKEQINHEHPLNNHVIISLNDAHGANIIKWWQKQGIDINGLCGYIRSAYGLHNNTFGSYHDGDIEKYNLKVITLPNPLMDYCIKGTYDEVALIYESIGIKPINYGEVYEIQYFIISGNEMNAYINEKVVHNTIITPDQAKQMIEEFYAPESESKNEVKEDKPTYPYLAKVWDNEDDDEVIGLVVSEIEIGNPIYKFSVVVENDMMNFIKNAPFSHNNYKNAEPINYDLDSINEQLNHIAAKVKLRKSESIAAQKELEEVQQKQSELLKIKRTLELIEIQI